MEHCAILMHSNCQDKLNEDTGQRDVKCNAKGYNFLALLAEIMNLLGAKAANKL